MPVIQEQDTPLQVAGTHQELSTPSPLYSLYWPSQLPRFASTPDLSRRLGVPGMTMQSFPLWYVSFLRKHSLSIESQLTKKRSAPLPRPSSSLSVGDFVPECSRTYHPLTPVLGVAIGDLGRHTENVMVQNLENLDQWAPAPILTKRTVVFQQVSFLSTCESG